MDNEKPRLGLVSGVTNETYAKLGSRFIAAHDGEGFLIALKEGKSHGVEYHPTLQQWGAWLSYFRRKNIPTRFMKTRDYWTVPAEWPHLFDTEASIQSDMEAGWHFENRSHGNEHGRKFNWKDPLAEE
jgi:hypothetical protein